MDSLLVKSWTLDNSTFDNLFKLMEFGSTASTATITIQDITVNTGANLV